MVFLKNLLLFLVLSFSVLALAYGGGHPRDEENTPAPLEGYSVPPPPEDTEINQPAPAPSGANTPAPPAPLEGQSLSGEAEPEPLEAYSAPPFNLGRPREMLTKFEFTQNGRPLTPDQIEFLLYVYPKLKGRAHEELDKFVKLALQILSERVPAVSEIPLAEDGDMMGAFMQAAQVLDSPGYRKMSDAVSEYVEQNLYDKDSGAFFDSRAGERAVYTCPNARVALGYLRAYRTTGNRRYLSTAVDLMEYVMKTLKEPGKGLPPSGQPLCQSSYLATRIYSGLASLQAYEATGEAKYLDFAAETAVVADVDSFPSGAAYVEDGARAALMLAELYDITGVKKFMRTSRRLVSSLMGRLPGVESWPAVYAMAVERIGGGAYSFVVVGPVDDLGTAALLKKSYTYEAPDRVVVVLDPERDKKRIEELGYEYEGKPMLYVCSQKTCFPPVAPGESLAKTREAIKKAEEMQKN